jgi:signal transduction histidine kinase
MQWPPKLWQAESYQLWQAKAHQLWLAKSKLWQKPQTDEAFRSVAPIVAAIGGLMLWHSLQPGSQPGSQTRSQPGSQISSPPGVLSGRDRLETSRGAIGPTVTQIAKATIRPDAKATISPDAKATISPVAKLPSPPPNPLDDRRFASGDAPRSVADPRTAAAGQPTGNGAGSWAFGWLLLLGMAGEIALLAWLYGLLRQSRFQRRRAEQREPVSLRSGLQTGVQTGVQTSVQTDVQTGVQNQPPAQGAAERLDPDLADLRTRLITTLSHEYRTPLTTILTTTELLERYGSKISEANKQRYTQRIRQSVQDMATRLDEVLLLHQANLGQLRCRPQAVDVWLLCQDLLEEARLQTGQHQFFLNDQPLPPSPLDLMTRSAGAESGGDPLPPQVQIDPQLARSALANLLTNAVQFSPSGGRIQLAVMYQDLAAVALSPQLGSPPGGPPIARSGFVIFQLRDEGMGIAAADQAHLGEPFYRGSNVGEIRGAGMGLAIAQHCVAAHGGSLQLLSELGQGTTVRVTLPIG